MLDGRRALLVALAALPFARPSAAQTWRPSKPVDLIVGFPPGGPTDSVARMLQSELEKSLGQPLVVLNVAGANGEIAIKRVALAERDGHTLLVAGAEILLSKEGREQLVPVALVANLPLVLVSRSNVSLDQLRKLSSPRIFVSGFYAPLLLRQLGVVKPVVEFRQSTSQAIIDLLSGKLDAAIISLPAVRDAIASKQITPIAVFGTAPEFKGLPPLSLGQNAGFAFIGLFAPSGTPKTTIDSLNDAVNRALGSPLLKEQFAKIGVVPTTMSQQAFASMVQVQAGVTPDSCKKKDTCEADAQCPRPCPNS